MSDQHEIPWGLPGPTDPVERAWATGIELDGDHFRLVRPTEWSQDGIPQDLRDPEDTER